MNPVTDLDDLRVAVEGPVLTPADDGYADETASWNLAVVHRPDVVVGALHADDVVAAVRWASRHRVPVAVQATGHGATQAQPDGLLISTRRMQGVDVDARARTARVGAGVRWKAVLPQIAPHGLAALNGSSSDVGVVGYTLGGGLPLLGRAFGFAADLVRSIEVVTPDGVLRTVDAEHDADLFQVLRGGKGNVGVVTALEFSLVPLPDFTGGSIMYPGADADEVLTAFRGWLPTLPDAASPSITLMRMPEDDAVPEPMRGQFLVQLAFAYAGPFAEADRLLTPMRAVSHPLMDTIGPLPYDQADLVSMDPADPIPFEEAGELLRDFDAAAQAALLAVAGPDADTPLVMVNLQPLGGALARPSAVLDAVSGRDAAWSLLGLGVLVPPIADLVPPALERLMDAMRPWTTGRTMANFHGRPGDAADRARAWEPDAYDAISRAKRRYDPDGMLRFGLAVLLPDEQLVEPALPLQ